MFAIQKKKTIVVNEKLAANQNIAIKVAGIKKEIELKVLALNKNILTVCESKNPGVIFVIDSETSKIKNIITNQEMMINSAITVKDKLPVDISTLTFAGNVVKVTQEELFAGDKFLYNKVQDVQIMYITGDKTLMIVKFLSSKLEVPVKDTDSLWLAKTNIKGVAR